MASSWRYGKRNKYRAKDTGTPEFLEIVRKRYGFNSYCILQHKASQDPEDYYRLDPKKSAAENVYDIYTGLCCRETRDTKRLFLLNGLATLCEQQHQHQHQQPRSQLHTSTITRTTIQPTTDMAASSSSVAAKNNLGFTTEELLYCLSASLIHTFTQVRAAALRTIRYILHIANDIKVFNALQLPHLLCRSIDLKLKNDDERVQALKLIRKMLAVSPEDISPSVVRCLVSLADTGIEEGDSLLRACLAILCEFGVLNPILLICCGGVTSLTRNVLECHNPRIAESLSGVLLYLLEWPRTRNICGVRLDCLAAPYCDFTYRLSIMDKNKDIREFRYTSCRLALLSVLHSWTGTIEFCDPSKPSGLKAIVDALHLNQMEVRKAILELLYELLGLPQPTWTDDYTVALQTVDPSDFQDNWLLNNGFVAAEGRSILPSLASRAPNVCEQHLSLQLFCFLETGLLNALVEVIVQNDAAISVAATILLGKLLYLMHTHLPADICSTCPALPLLIAHAAKGNHQASAAITTLQSYHKMLRNRPASNSLFLDSIIQEGALINTRLFKREFNTQDLPASVNSQSPPKSTTLSQMPAPLTGLERSRLDSVSSSDESNSQTSSTRRSSFRLKCKFLPFLDNIKVNRLIKDSNVLGTGSDDIGWDWEVINTILRSNLIRKIDDTATKFLKTIIEYFKPSNNLFSHLELLPGRSLPIYVTVGLDLIDCLLTSHSLESMRLLTDFFSDVAQHLLAITTSNRAHDCLFSPHHMTNTMCQQYFLYIGRMCRVQKGITILTNTAVFEHLISLVRNTDHDCYVKLIVSGLDYSLESVTRKVLENALTSAKARSGRLYATQFLTVLLRARIPNFEEWGIPMIIHQIKDRDRSVVLTAMDVLEEACHERYYLEEVVSLWPNLKCLGDMGRLLMARYYSISRGLNHPKAKIKDEIEYWRNGYNKRYVLLVEADTHSSLTLHVRNEDGYYSRRNCNTRPIIIPPNIPPHLYGQMVQTTKGITELRKYGDLPQLMEVIGRGKCDDEQECLELKAAIWAISHASTHSNGVEYFLETEQRIYEKLVLLATKCEVYSIRACCFNGLGLIGGTNAGANVLFKLNWLSVRHDRNAFWPVQQPEDWMVGNVTLVRHHYEDVPPYNYAAMEDQIDSSCYIGSYWNLLLSRDAMRASVSLEAQDGNTTTDSIKTSGEEVLFKQVVTAGGVNAAGAKSKTLPVGSYPHQSKHQRSLSESKTTDVISLISGGSTAAAAAGIMSTSHSHRIHYNSCTDSNTSGVSSCESVTGKLCNAVDFQQFPLSPIPSMSNLLEIPLGESALIKRMHSVISPMDVRGYAQFRSLRKNCRPVLSESAAEIYDLVDHMELLSFGSFRPRKSSFGESQRKTKVRSLDRQASLRMYAQLDTEEALVPLPNITTPKILSQNDSQGPCYTGISLPKNLLDLFPRRNLSCTYVSQNIPDQDFMEANLLTAKQHILNDSFNMEAGDESSVISSLSDVSSVSKRFKWTAAKHGRIGCLHCSRLRRSSRTNSHHSGGGESLNSLTTPCEIYTNASAALVAAGIQASAVFSRKTSKNNNSEELTKQQSRNVTSAQVYDMGSFQSPESAVSEESPSDKLTTSILYNVQRLANPVSAKQSKTALLELKQKHSALFQDICLYSEVCKNLGRFSYRMNARRFLQELFLDLDFDSFYNDPLQIVSKKDKDLLIHKRKGEEHRGAATLSPKTAQQCLEEHHGHGHGQQQHRGKNQLPSTSHLISCEGKGGDQLSISSSVNPNSTTTSSSNFSNQSLKTHLKSQHLASLYEASCENLHSEPSPSSQRVKQANDLNILENCKKITMTPPPPAAPPPPKPKKPFKNELRIASDDDDDDDEVEGERDNRHHSLNRTVTSDCDEVDGGMSSLNYNLQPASDTTLCSTPLNKLGNNHNSCTHSASQTTLPHLTTVSSSTLKYSSNYSDQIISISNHQCQQSVKNNSNILNASTSFTSQRRSVPIENENKKYTRGRFYTLELDLSCTKNKFPITDRTRSKGNDKISINTCVSTTTINTTTTATTPLQTNSNILEVPTTAIAIISPSTTTTTLSSLSSTYTQPHINTNITLVTANNPATRYRQPLVRQSYTTTGLCSTHTPGNNVPTDLSSNFTLTITKSLAASLVQPIGKLYCEKRLQCSKSEALLSHETSTITVHPTVTATATVTVTAAVATIQTKSHTKSGNIRCGGGVSGMNSCLTAAAATTARSNVFGASKQS